jgi:hypothetical protein
MPYLTRRGRIRIDATHELLPYVEAPDDGAIAVCLGDSAVRCVDCDGVGTLAWAPAPTAHYVPRGRPWLQVCQRCCAHWDVEGVPYYVLQDDSLVLGSHGEHLDVGFGGGLGVYARLDEPVSEKIGAPTHRTIVESVSVAERKRLIEAARERFRETHNFFKGPYRSVPLRAVWARRGRFHPITTSADLKIDIQALTPECVLAYFERLSVEQPACDIWAEGAEATREWHALMQDGGASQQRVDALLARVRVPCATMFVQLGYFVAHWAREADWRVR